LNKIIDRLIKAKDKTHSLDVKLTEDEVE